MERTALVEITKFTPLLEKAEDGLTKLSGIASEAGVMNGNGRVYPVEVMRRAVEEAQLKIDEGAFNGELDHPEWGYRGQLKNTAMRFTKLFMEGTVVKFEAVLLETPDGNTLRGLLNGGVKIGMSTRGAGSLRYEESEDGEEILYVDSDYEMFGIDAVDIPSSANGILKLQESIEASINKEKNLMAEKVIKNVEELKEAYGPLVTKVEEATKAEASQALQEGQTEIQNLKTQLETANTELETTKTHLVEATKSVEAMAEVKKTVLGEAAAAKPVGDDVVATKVEQMLENLQTELKAAREETKNLREAQETEKNKATLATELNDLFESEVKGADHEEILRKRIDPAKFETVDALKTKINEYREVLGDTPKANLNESVKEGKGEGKGKIKSDNGDDQQVLDEAERRERILSGLNG